MNHKEFAYYRERLKKTQSQFSQLLGVSLSAVKKYESGQRVIPAHVERQVFFLISRVKTEDILRKPCWIQKNCPPEWKLNCPAWEFQAGTYCWFINGTMCKGKPQKNWQEKMKLCRNCKVLTSISIVQEANGLSVGDNPEPIDESPTQFGRLVGKHDEIQIVYELIKNIAGSNTTVLIQGESGTGKELVARAIHDESLRYENPFIVINCSAYPDTLIESELFGHEKGAFTGAIRQKKGRFEQADKGSVFLDEIGDISPSAQIKLLRVLQSRKFEKLGGEDVIDVNVRVIAATNRDLLEEVKKGNFREDLYYRLNVFPITLPPLRKRKNDIPLLANHFSVRFAAEQGKELQGFDSDAIRALFDYSWPGNVRELENCIEHAAVLAKGNRIEAGDLPIQVKNSHHFTALESSVTIEQNEKKMLQTVLADCNGNKKLTAQRLGISRSTLYAKLKKFHDFTAHPQ